ncbi:MAG: tripartite tricarboxylate transporter permease [Syntrophaceae bacterium]|nr:tripartite tricarboxylate transporter permease [Syntrophaceae bacterium]
MDSLAALGNGFSLAVTPVNLLFGLIGAVLGTAIGVLPGLGPAATISLLLPLSYALGNPVTSIIMLAGIYYGAMYGGSTTSILLNIPGEAASVVTCIDGYQMAKKGRAGAALGMAAIGSFIAGTAGVIGLTFVAPPLSAFALKFGPAEYFSLTILGLMLATYLSGQSVLKGIIMAVLGLLLATVGMDPVTGNLRYTFGLLILEDGFDFLTLGMGLFGIGEIFSTLEGKVRAQLVTRKISNLWPTLKDWAVSKWSILRGSGVGFLVGLLPGGGAVIASLLSYAIEKRASKEPEKFGQGALEGVAGPESANNSAASASFIPMLTLGIPGNPAIAMIFAALLIQGVTPGPLLIKDHPQLFWAVIASMYIGNFLLLILNLPLVGIWVQMLKVPYSILAPFIVLICSIGVYSMKNDVSDVLMMVIFGVVGYVLRKFRFELGPLLLAFVLGRILERSLRQALLISKGDLGIFIQKPISAFLLAAVALMILFSASWAIYRRFSSPPTRFGPQAH